MVDRFQSIRNIRGAFRLALFWLTLFVIGYSWHSWETVKKAEENQLSLLAELESKSLDAFFSHFESHLRMLSQELLKNRISMESMEAHLLLKRFRQASPFLANLVIVRTDGQLIASANNPPGSKFPSYASESSFISGLETLRSGTDYEVGRPIYGKLVKEWTLPLRYAIRDANGKLLYFLTAPLSLSQQQNFWTSYYLPHSALIGLLRDDGYLLSLYPLPQTDEQEAAYSKPRTGVIINYLKANTYPQNGVVQGVTTRQENSAAAFHRLTTYPVTLFVTTSLSYIRGQWWKANQAFYFLISSALLFGFGIYLWLVRQQSEWEIEREASNRKIIEADREKDRAKNELLALELDDVKLALNHHSVVSIADVSGNITYVNHKFCERSGYSSEELIGQNHRILNSGLHSRKYFADMWQTITSGKLWHGQVRNKARDGSYYWEDSTIVPFLNKEGKPYQYVSVRTDITALIQARAEAEEANSAKSQFLSSIGHELRTPLNSILGFGQMLDMQIAPERQEQHESVQHILMAGNQLSGLINDLLDLSRIETGKLELNIRNIGIAQIVADSLDLVVSNLIKNKHITIENNISDTALCVKGDEQRLRQVLINLLSNAVKYNRHNGKVILNCEIQQDGKVRVQVTDTGIGIASDKLPLLFNPFERLGQQHGSIDGAGIGLYVCKHLIEAMHGEIGAESAKGKGSTFWFVLPQAE